jgi:hypothetical protein
VLKLWRTHLKTRIAKIRGVIATILRIVRVSSKGRQWKIDALHQKISDVSTYLRHTNIKQDL